MRLLAIIAIVADNILDIIVIIIVAAIFTFIDFVIIIIIATAAAIVVVGKGRSTVGRVVFANEVGQVAEVGVVVRHAQLSEVRSGGNGADFVHLLREYIYHFYHT